MKPKLIAVIVYAATCFALTGLLDGLYGGEPITHHLRLVQAATAGAALFAAAGPASLFTLRIGVACGLAGGVLSWPYFGLQISMIPWGSLLSILAYAGWLDLLTCMLALAVASVYSGIQLQMLLRGRNGPEARNMGPKILAALLYAASVVVLTSWHAIGDWLFRMRYGS